MGGVLLRSTLFILLFALVSHQNDYDLITIKNGSRSNQTFVMENRREITANNLIDHNNIVIVY